VVAHEVTTPRFPVDVTRQVRACALFVGLRPEGRLHCVERPGKAVPMVKVDRRAYTCACGERLQNAWTATVKHTDCSVWFELSAMRSVASWHCQEKSVKGDGIHASTDAKGMPMPKQEQEKADQHSHSGSSVDDDPSLRWMNQHLYPHGLGPLRWSFRVDPTFRSDIVSHAAQHYGIGAAAGPWVWEGVNGARR
jgi:hypothetical protein